MLRSPFSPPDGLPFLDYCLWRLLGPPARREGPRYYWNCPFHEDDTPSFGPLPPKEGVRDRAYCHGCRILLDTDDLLRSLWTLRAGPPRCKREQYSGPDGRAAVAAAWVEAWGLTAQDRGERESPGSRAAAKNTTRRSACPLVSSPPPPVSVGISPPAVSRSNRKVSQDWSVDLDAIERVYDSLTDEERQALLVVRRIGQLWPQVRLEDLADWAWEVEELVKAKGELPSLYEQFMENSRRERQRRKELVARATRRRKPKGGVEK